MSGWGAIYNNLVYAMARQSQNLARIQEQVASGSRVQHASDDPQAAASILSLRDQTSRIQTYSKNLDEVQRKLQNNYSVLEDASTSLTRVQQLLTQASTGTYDSGSRSAMAGEVDSILEQMVSEANTQDLGHYSFGGDKTTVAPYQVERSGGQIVSVQYVGSQTDAPSPVSAGVDYSRLVVGDRIFSAHDRQAPTFLGSTGAAAGGATSSVRGNVWLSVTHTATTYDAASQITAAVTSPGLDTALGAHTITITDTGGGQTIRMDDGTDVAFTASDTDLVLCNTAGAVVHVNAGAWAGATGTFTVQSAGTLSIDDGATTVPLTADGNIAVTDSRTGGILYVNGGGVTQTGLEPIRVPGTADLFNTLIAVRDAMTNTRSLPQDQQVDLLDQAMAGVQEVMGAITVGITSLGGRIQALETLGTSLQSQSDAATEQADGMQNADIATVTADLARIQNLYQMTLTASGKLLGMSLLSFL